METCRCKRRYGKFMKRIDGTFKEHCIECGQLIGQRMIDAMDAVEDGPISRNRRAVPRFKDLERLSNKIYDIHTPTSE